MPTKRGGRRPGPRRTPVRRRTARRRTTRRRRQRATARLGAGAAALLLAASWPTVRPHLLAVAAAGVAGALLWWLRRTDRLHRSGERRRREAEAVRAGQLSLAEVDALSWQEFERYVAGLCRRDGCRDVVVTGGSGDLGADVTATLPDGRRLVIQCKHYAPHRYVPSGDMQKFLGTAWLHHRADVAVFAATCPFGKAALALAAEHRIVAVHRDLLGLWNTGTPLTALLGLGGAGQGGAAHRRRWRETYGRG
ncbi:restriction endonuclease [Streptomyces diastaticus]